MKKYLLTKKNFVICSMLSLTFLFLGTTTNPKNKSTTKTNNSTKVVKTTTDRNGKKMYLLWNDEFNSKKVNYKYWSKCERGGADWKNYMSDLEELVTIKNGNLLLKGMVNPDQKKDPVPFVTGGVLTKNKFSFQYGKIEVRAKYDSAKGCWPAIWMLGNEGRWPANGELDLMEHLNFDNKIYQTVHSAYTNNKSKSNPPASTAPAINPKEYNVYGAEWDENSVTFTLNGKPTLTYPRKAELGKEQYPFEQPFYIILSMQIEGSWVGKADPTQYPTYMYIDWVRVYSYDKPSNKKKK